MFKIFVDFPLETICDSTPRAGVEVPVRTCRSRNIRLYRQEQSLLVDSESTPTVLSQTVVALALPISYEITKLFLVDKFGIPQFKPPKLVTLIQNTTPPHDDVQFVVFDFESIDDARKFYDANHGRWLDEGRYQSLCLKLVFAFPLEEEEPRKNPAEETSPPKLRDCSDALLTPLKSSQPSSSSPSPPPSLNTPTTVLRASPSPPLAAAEEMAGNDVHERVSRSLSPSRVQCTELVELPNCAVCLDRLDPSIAGVGPGVCMHQFMTSELSAGVFCDCWKVINRENCRVCTMLERFSASTSSSSPTSSSSSSEIKVACEVCQIEDRLWSCLVCGYVGCGRYTAEHSLKHYFSSGHRWALDLTNRRIWDYSADNYAHRLPGGGFGVMSSHHIQSSSSHTSSSHTNGDFKGNMHHSPHLSSQSSEGYGEYMGGGGWGSKGLCDENNSSSSSGGGGGYGGGGGVDKKSVMMNKEEEDQMSADVFKSGKLGPTGSSYFDAGDYGDQENVAKLGGLAREYEQLLLTQLSEQRRYYEQLLSQEMARIAAENAAIDEKALDNEKMAITQVKDSIQELESELELGMIALRSAETELRHTRKEQVRLLAEQQEKERQVRNIKAETSKEQRSCEEHVKELQATITELTFFHRTREEVNQSPNKEEIRSGHVLVGESSSTQSEKGRDKGRNGRRNGRR